MSAYRQSGYAFLVASLTILLLLSAVIAYHYTELKSNTVSSTQVESADMEAMKAAALAAKAGVEFVNNLSISALCAGSTGCNSGVYPSGVLVGGAALQGNAWWNTSNAHVYSHANLSPNPLYAIEYMACDANSGVSTYSVTGRAISNSSASSAKQVYIYHSLATKTWPKITKTLYDYACDTQVRVYPGSHSVSFVAGAPGNISSLNVDQPFPVYGNGEGRIDITEIRVGIGNWSQASTLNLTVRVNGVLRYSGTLASPSMSVTGYSQCASGSNSSVLTLPTPISVNAGDTVTLDFGQACVTGYGCTPTASPQFQIDTQGQFPGNNSPTQVRYRVIGEIVSCP